MRYGAPQLLRVSHLRFKAVNSNGADSFDVNIKLDNRNYTNLTNLATNFADKIRAQLASAINAATEAAAHTDMTTIVNDNIMRC